MRIAIIGVFIATWLVFHAGQVTGPTNDRIPDQHITCGPWVQEGCDFHVPMRPKPPKPFHQSTTELRQTIRSLDSDKTVATAMLVL